MQFSAFQRAKKKNGGEENRRESIELFGDRQRIRQHARQIRGRDEESRGRDAPTQG